MCISFLVNIFVVNTLTMNKKCTTCKLVLNISNFQKQKNGKYGVTSICKNCKKEYWQKNKQKFSEAAKKRYLKNQNERN